MSKWSVSPQELASRKRDTRIVQMGDALAVVGIERYKIKVKDLARLLGKSDDGVSIWGRRGAQRRLDDKKQCLVHGSSLSMGARYALHAHVTMSFFRNVLNQTNISSNAHHAHTWNPPRV